MSRVLITRPLPQRVLDSASDLFDTTIRSDTTPLTASELRSSLQEFDAVLPTLGDQYDAQVFADVSNPRCRLLANFGVGFNHIDVSAARSIGISVTNTPGAVTDATADVALTLMLMSARRAGEGERLLRAGQWEGWHPTQLLGMHLSGKTVGVVGMGRIGQAVAKRCHFGFEMRIRYFNRSPKQFDFDVERSDSLSELMSLSDVVVLAVPGGSETHHLINKDVLSAMQPHAHLINISRGNVIDEQALVNALRTGQLAGAGLDVYEFEPQVPAELRQMENVTLLPHLGTAALEVRENMGMMALDNLKAHFAGRSLPNLV